ncbi:LLM class flavin-dependent oxidoreductase [Corynebacterium glyciniphilum]|uniref:LLM class flavin-dependent oxidoreductase n=1 Tax=Corynebacterium glyciniphilum TaxID=1404244 RepID=UPI0023578DA4
MSTNERHVPLSLIDFATVYDGETSRDAFLRSVGQAQHAERLGYSRIWYAEHHNMPRIASSAPAVLISHIAAKTETIRLGSGGVMLPNHSPLVIAEQYGTLAELYPDRIDLGVGRAPGTDQRTVLALRRDPRSAESFPQDVQELQGYLAGRSRVPGVTATPGADTHVPVYILGSSLFGAQLAAKLGLPYSFASHFAPDALKEAVSVYRETYQPSKEHPDPYVIAAVNVTAADTEADAATQNEKVRRGRVESMALRGRKVSQEDLDLLMSSPAAEQILSMLRYSAVGTGEQVREYLEGFTATAQADELMVAIQSPSTEQSLRGMEILADVWGL